MDKLKKSEWIREVTCYKCKSVKVIKLIKYVCNKKICGFNNKTDEKEMYCRGCLAYEPTILEDCGCTYCFEERD